MANPTAIKSKAVDAPKPQPVTAMSVVVPAIAWLIPGAGHLIQKRYVRGLLLMASISTMFLLGLALQGRVYKPTGGGILDILGLAGHCGAGGLSIVTRAMAWRHGGIAP